MDLLLRPKNRPFARIFASFCVTIPLNISPTRVWTLAMALAPIRMPLCTNWGCVIGGRCASRGSTVGRSAR
jgi:hypothetical protein